MKYSASLGAPGKLPVSHLLLQLLGDSSEFTQASLREVLDKCSEAHKLDLQAIVCGIRACMDEVGKIKDFQNKPVPIDPPALKTRVHEFLGVAAGQSEELAQLLQKVQVDDLRELQEYLALTAAGDGAERTLPAMLESLGALRALLPVRALPVAAAGPALEDAPVSAVPSVVESPAPARDPLAEWLRSKNFKEANASRKTLHTETFPLHTAVRVKTPDVSIVKLLLERQADPNVIEKGSTGTRWTPLQLARARDKNGSHKDVIETLDRAVEAAMTSDVEAPAEEALDRAATAEFFDCEE